MVFIVLESSGTVSPETPAPWVVTGTESRENEFLQVFNDIIVESGGVLTITSCQLEMVDPGNSVGIDIEVKQGGTLNIIGCDLYGNLDALYGQTYYDFVVNGRLTASESTFANIGGVGPVGGLQIYSSDVTLYACLMRDSPSSGVYVKNAAPSLEEVITLNTVYGYYFDGDVQNTALSTFADGDTQERRTLIGASSSSDISLSLPSGARISSAEIRLQGSFHQPTVAAGSPYSGGFAKGMGIDAGWWFRYWDPGQWERGIYAADDTKGLLLMYDLTNPYVLVPITMPNQNLGYDLTNPVDATSDGSYAYVIDGAHVDKFTARPDGGGSYIETYSYGLKSPQALDFGEGQVYVADGVNKVKALYTGTTISTNIAKAMDIAVHDGRIYVVDSNTHIDVLTTDGTHLFTISDSMTKPISIDVEDMIYVIDDTRTTDELVVFGLDGSFVCRTSASLSGPKGVTVDDGGHVFVQDATTHMDVFDKGFPLNPKIDIGSDGDFEWTYNGFFSTSVVLNGDNSAIVEELQSCIDESSTSTANIPITIQCDATGEFTISDVLITYSMNTDVQSCLAFNNVYGMMFEDSSSVRCSDIRVRHNTQGIHLVNSGPTIQDSSIEFNTNYDMYLEDAVYPTLVNVIYDGQKVYLPTTADSDGDGLQDAVEVFKTKTNPALSDTDGDGFADGLEVSAGADPLSPTDMGPDDDCDLLGILMEIQLGTSPTDSDTDGDGISDGVEHYFLASNPLDFDTDGDGLGDGIEKSFGLDVNLPDSDSDGVQDGTEIAWSSDSDGDGKINALDSDSDGDTLLDGAEITLGTDPLVLDTDNDLLNDSAEKGFWDSLGGLSLVDSDNDGFPNVRDIDSDNDCLRDGQESRLWWTADSDSDLIPNVLDGDSDDDGISDGEEVLGEQIGGTISIEGADWAGVENRDGMAKWTYDPIAGSAVVSESIDEIYLSVGTWTDGTQASSTQSFIAFDTTRLPDDAQVVSATLHATVSNSEFSTDFGVQVYNTHYGPSLTPADWDALGTYQGTIVTASQAAAGQTYGLAVMPGAINVNGYTEFVLKPSVNKTDETNLVVFLGSEWGVGAQDSGLALDIQYVTRGVAFGTSATSSDSDADGLEDYEELFVYMTGPCSEDTDYDLLSDQEEVVYWSSQGMDPAVVDTDNDGMRNIVDPDSDGDNLPDGWEIQNGLDPGAPLTLPGPPEMLWANPGDQCIFLSWYEPVNKGGSDIMLYRIYRSEVSMAETFLADVSGDSLEYTDTGLVNGVWYYYRISAVNLLGEGPLSYEVSRAPCRPPSAPLNCMASPGQLNGSVFVEWDPPADDGGSRIQSYGVYMNNTEGEFVLLYYVKAAANANTKINLVRGVTYYFKITAVNVGGESPFSNVASSVPACVPTPPRNLQAQAGDSQVYLTWLPPEDDGGTPVWRYIVGRGTEPGGLDVLYYLDLSLEYTDYEVTNGVTYYYSVYAENGIGFGYRSEEVACMPCATPSAPLDFVATGGNMVIALSWSPPADTGGVELFGYKIFKGLSSGGEGELITLDDTILSYDDYDVDAGVPYYYYVKAYNIAGPGLPSVEQSAVALGVPTAPVSLTAQPGNGVVTLDWLPPVSDGGTNITLYKILRRTGSNPVSEIAQVPYSTTHYVDSGLGQNQFYYYSVKAVNALGDGPACGEVSAQTWTTPSAPINPQLTPMSTSISINWTKPVSTGGAQLLGYRIFRGETPGGGTQVGSVGPQIFVFLSSGLSSTKTYYFRVVAYNDVGSGTACTEVSSKPLRTPTVPTAPLNLAMVPIIFGEHGIKMKWEVPMSNGGNAVTSYVILRSTLANKEVPIATIGSSAISYNDLSVTAGTLYYYKVRAHNAKGDGALSNEISVRAPTALLAASKSSLQSVMKEDAGSQLTEINVNHATQTSKLGSYATLSNAEEWPYLDDDDDGLANGDEGFTDGDGDGITYSTSPFFADTDDDGIDDLDEVNFWTSLRVPPDDLPIRYITTQDSDNDGLTDGEEKEFFEKLKANDPSSPSGPGDDVDQDGLINILDRDSDNDGVSDSEEMMHFIGQPLDQLYVFDQNYYGWDFPWVSSGTEVNIPVVNGIPAPVKGGQLKISGVETGGGLFGDNYKYYSSLQWITGVATADFNGDGKIDIVAVNEAGMIAYLRNNDNTGFMLVRLIDHQTGSFSGICAGDFDKDGRPDLAVTDFVNNKVSVFFNNGEETFASPVDITVGPKPLQIVSGPSGDVWTANNDGTTVSRITFSSRTPTLWSYTVADGDKPKDIYVAVMDGAGTIAFLTANTADKTVFMGVMAGDNVIMRRTQPFTDFEPKTVVALDVNGGGVKDIVVTDRWGNLCTIYQYPSLGDFLTPVFKERPDDMPPNVVDAQAADLDQDSFDDLVYVEDSQWSTIRRHLNPLGGGLGQNFYNKAFETTPMPSALAMADVTGDGYPDAIIGHYWTENTLEVRPDGMFPDTPYINIYPGILPLNESIFNHDGPYSGTVTISNFYDYLLDYLERHPMITDGYDGDVDGRITLTLFFHVLGPGSLKIESPDIGRDFFTMDPFNDDMDGDGFKDGEEIRTWGTDPRMDDTDNDGLSDSVEAAYWQSEGVSIFSNDDKDCYENLLLDPDCDNDGLYDSEEIARGTDPLKADTDSDGLEDYLDLSPSRNPPSDALQWTTQYQAGMLRITQDIDTLYFFKARAMKLDNGAVIYTGDWNDQKEVKTAWPMDEDVKADIEENNPDYEVKSQTRNTFMFPETTLSTTYGGDHRYNYRFDYEVASRNDTVTLANRNAMPYEGQSYALAKIGVIPNVDTSIVLQLRINRNDWTTYVDQDRFVLPGFCFALYEHGNFQDPANVPLYSYMATGTPLGGNYYQFELRLPKEYLITDNLVQEASGDWTAFLYLCPKWISKAYGPAFYSNWDPATFSLCAAVEKVPQGSNAVYVRQTEDLDSIVAALPGSYDGLNGGPYYYGAYKIYVRNLMMGGSFDPAVITDLSYDAIVIVGYSANEVRAEEATIDWGTVDDGWYVPTIDDYGDADILKDAIDARAEAFDLTYKRAVAWWTISPATLRVRQHVPLYESHVTMLRRVADGDGNSLTIGYQRDQYLDAVIESDIPITIATRHVERQQTGDPDKFLLDPVKYDRIKIGLTGAQLGATVVCDGHSAFLAFRDGNVVRGLAYMLEGGVDAYTEVRTVQTALNGMKVPDWWGNAATIAVGAIEIGYDAYEYFNTNDEMLKLAYTEKIFATAIDTGISLIPGGAIVGFTWSATIAFMSWAVPDPMAKKICGSIGTFVVFISEYYFGTKMIPSTFATSAYEVHALWLYDEAVRRNNNNDVTRIYLPPEDK